MFALSFWAKAQNTDQHFHLSGQYTEGSGNLKSFLCDEGPIRNIGYLDQILQNSVL